METQSLAEENLKRQRDDNESDQQRKSQRMASLADLEHTTKIIDLNDDCLIKVFGYLDLRNLFNVAVANEYLRPAAREVYARKFSSKTVVISRCDNRWNRGISTPMDYSRHIYSYGFKSSFQFLRCFGSSVSNLTIDYNRSICKRYEHLHQYINEYCAASLVRIEFWFMPTFEMDPFTKVFVKVKEVGVLGICLEQHLQSFAKWFPNLNRMNLQHNKCGQRFTADPFQHLEHLSVFDFQGDQNGFVADLLRGAHQLKTMNIETFGKQEFPIETLLDMIKDKPLLTELLYDSARTHRPMPVDLLSAQRIINDHPALVKLVLPEFQITRAGVDALIGQLDSLKAFRFVMRHDDFYDLCIQLENEWHSSHSGSVYFNGGLNTLASFFRIKQ